MAKIGRKRVVPRLPRHGQLAEALSDLHRQAGSPSTRRLAEVAGVSHDTVYRVLRSERVPQRSALRAVVQALGGDVDLFETLWQASEAERAAPGGQPPKALIPPQGQRRSVEATRFRDDTFLSGLTGSDRSHLREIGLRRRIAAGHRILTEGVRGGGVYILERGVVTVGVDSSIAWPHVLEFLGPGSLLGVDGLSGSLSETTVTAVTQVWVTAIRNVEFLSFLAVRKKAVMAVIAESSARLRRSNQWRVDAITLPVAERVKRTLRELMALAVEADPDAVECKIRVTQSMIAPVIGATEGSVHIALRELKARGVIATGYRSITVLKPADLELAVLDEVV